MEDADKNEWKEFWDKFWDEQDRINSEPCVENRTADELREMIRVAQENDGVYNGVLGYEMYEGDLIRRLEMLEGNT